jgi:hypothetical protein
MMLYYVSVAEADLGGGGQVVGHDGDSGQRLRAAANLFVRIDQTRDE